FTIDCRTPEPVDVTSILTLSVSSSTSASPWVTGSPSPLSQRPTVASTMDSPNAGTVTSIDILHSACFDLRPAFTFKGRLDNLSLLHLVCLVRSNRRAGALGTTQIVEGYAVRQDTGEA